MTWALTPRILTPISDGLNDGEEIRYAANPQVLDTDGDTLADGVEVKNGTSPIKDDTDGDGLKDNVDPDPLQPPTPTPPPDYAATATVQAQLTETAGQATAAAGTATYAAMLATERARDAIATAASATQAAVNAAQQQALAAQVAQVTAEALARVQTATAAAQATQEAHLKEAQTIAPPTDTPTPFPAPPPQPGNVGGTEYLGTINVDCNLNDNRVRFEGYVQSGNLPVNGVHVLFGSRFGGTVLDETTGPSNRRPTWADGYYEHIVDADASNAKGKHLEIWLQNDSGEQISNKVPWNTDGSAGSCNYASINFQQP